MQCHAIAIMFAHTFSIYFYKNSYFVKRPTKTDKINRHLESEASKVA